MSTEFRFADLFSGIGGMRRGFEAIGGECVFSCEVDNFCRETYQANFHVEHSFAYDIRSVDDVPEHDLLLAGFPCQPFSIAGVSKRKSLNARHGFADEVSGNLFFDIARILEYRKPGVLLLENVKHLVGHDKGRTFKIIKQVLNELGYDIAWRVINARHWVPQNRERIFIAGVKTGTPIPLQDFKPPSAIHTLGEILHPEDGSERAEPPYTHGERAEIAGKYVLTDHLWNYLQSYAERHRKKGNGFGYGLVDADGMARTLSARYYKDGSEILIRGRGNPRRLTPRECSRLMGFDGRGESEFVIPVSDTQAYRQFGNAVVASLVDDLAKFMEPWLRCNAK